MFRKVIIYFVIQVGYEIFENSIPNDYQFNQLLKNQKNAMIDY
jgi:hypothetical protein